MIKENNTDIAGGPAFPLHHHPHPGMTLRDWFAGQWVAAGHHRTLRPYEAAEYAYEFADAMLAARAPDEGDTE